MNTNPETRKHPRGFYINFYAQMFMMYGFVMCNALLVLYASHKLGFPDKEAYALAGANTALLFASQFLGGFLSGRYLGYKMGFYVGSVLVSIGYAIFAIQSHTTLYIGLATLTMGFGLLVPSVYALLGSLYLDGDIRRESGFTYNYVGLNIGGFAAAASSGFITRYLGYETAFLFAAMSVMAGFFVFFFSRVYYRKHVSSKQTGVHVPSAKDLMMSALILLPTIALLMIVLRHAFIANEVLIGLGIFAIVMVIVIALQQSPLERNRLFAFAILTCVSIAFWALYMISINCLPIFSDRNVDRHVLGMLVPASSISSLNSFVVITLGTVLSILWLKLSKRGGDLSIPVKFAFALMQMGFGYLLLTIGIHNANAAGLVSLAWVALSYLFQTSGELFIAPIGTSMVGRLVPKRFEGLMLGVWAFSTGVSSSLSGYLSQSVSFNKGHQSPLLTNPVYSHNFTKFGLATLIIGVILFLVSPAITRLMALDEDVNAVEDNSETVAQA